MDGGDKAADLLHLTSEIVVAHLGNNKIGPERISVVIRTVHDALASRGKKAKTVAVIAGKPQPAVPAKKSVFPDYIICLEDGSLTGRVVGSFDHRLNRATDFRGVTVGFGNFEKL